MATTARYSVGSEIPFFSLRRHHAAVRRQLLAAFESVLDSSHFILGSELERFEESFAEFCKVTHAIGVGNGLDALGLILRALRVGPGDEVIVPGHTFVATWLAVDQVGAQLVPVDVDPGTFNLDPDRVEAAITPRTRVIIAVHLYGRLAPMERLAEIAARHGVFLIEDAAQAHGAGAEGRIAGGLATAAAFSFYPTKNLGALGDGGAITTSDQGLADEVRLLRNYGSREKYRHEKAGFNTRLDELQAALLSVKLRGLAENNQRRRDIARRYDAGLRDCPGIALPDIEAGTEAVWHLYVIRARRRAALQAALRGKGVGTQIHYPVPPHRQPAYAGRGFGRLELPVTEALADDVLSLPMWPEMNDDEVERVIDSVRQSASRDHGDAVWGTDIMDDEEAPRGMETALQV